MSYLLRMTNTRLNQGNFILGLVVTTFGFPIALAIFNPVLQAVKLYSIPVLAWLPFLPYLALVVSISMRRLHDMGKSGLLLLMLVVPFVNLLISMSLLIAKSQDQKNKYGPKDEGTSLKRIYGF